VVQRGGDHSTSVSWRAMRKPQTTSTRASSDSTEYRPFHGSGPIFAIVAVRQLSAETEVIVMTAYGSVENAVEAMREGAYDFITKPLKRAHVLAVVGKVIEKLSLVVENRTLRAQLEATKRRPIVGQSLAMRRTLEVVNQAAPSAATVLLLGESGTGKEVVAEAIHRAGPRASGAFVAVNMATLTPSTAAADRRRFP